MSLFKMKAPGSGLIKTATNLAAVVEEEVWSTLDTDPLKHLFVLTYEFDERQLINLAAGTPDLLKPINLTPKQYAAMASIRPLVVYDAAKTRPVFAIPQFVELHPYKSQSFCCHHSKAYCLVTEKKVVLILGSFNLTGSGLFKNREVLEYFVWDEARPGEAHLLGQWVDFLRDHYASRLPSSSSSALAELLETLRARLSQVPAEDWPEMSSLIISGYGHGGIQRLSDLWKAWFEDHQPEEVIAVSPFFDANPRTGNLAELLTATFPSLKRFTIFTDEDTVPMLTKEHFGPGPGPHQLFQIPGELCPGEIEAIQKLAVKMGLNTRDQVHRRRLHAKILILRSGGQGLIYLGSGNFTRRAWDDFNQELGLAFQFNSETVDLKTEIGASLYADDENKYPGLLDFRPEEGPIVLDEEGPDLQNHYPDFIEHIEMQPGSGDGVCFLIVPRAGADIETRQDYTVTWPARNGQAAEVDFTPFPYSSEIDPEECYRRLVGGRNLLFRHTPSGEEYWLPFQYHGDLIGDRHSLVWTSSTDWLLSFLSPDEGPTELTDYVRNEDDGRDDLAAGTEASDFREANPVIAMQRYLDLFDGFERHLRQRLAELTEVKHSGESKEMAAAEASLRLFLDILIREARPGQTDRLDAETLFKIGELIFFIRQLMSEKLLKDEVGVGVIRTADKYLQESSADSGEALRNNYLTFVFNH